MKHGALQSAEKYTKTHQRKKRWYRVVTGLACVVVFCTVYALILPAITMEKGACEIPEHTHSEACYTQVTSATRTEPVCTIESLNLHQHDDTCYDSEGNLIATGTVDFNGFFESQHCYVEITAEEDSTMQMDFMDKMAMYLYLFSDFNSEHLD